MKSDRLKKYVLSKAMDENKEWTMDTHKMRMIRCLFDTHLLIRARAVIPWNINIYFKFRYHFFSIKRSKKMSRQEFKFHEFH